MNLYVFAVRDSAVQAFGTPFFSPAIGAAVRSFGDEVQSGRDSELVRHPEHFTLCHVGLFDTDSGILTPLEAPREVAFGRDFKAS